MLNWIEKILEFKERKEEVALVTVTKCVGSSPCVVGSRMIVTKEKEIFGTVGGGKLEYQVIDDAIEALKSCEILERDYTLGPEFRQCCGGKVELIIEPMNQSPELYIFGAGHIGVELCKVVADTPFKVHLIDSRADWFTDMDLDPNIRVHEVDEGDMKTFEDAVSWGNNCYVLVLTHFHRIDFSVIAMALKKETKYLGLIGSKTKKVRFNNMLIKEMGISEGISNVVCPIGSETGDTPREIAIGVIAQLLQVHYNKEVV